MVSKDGGDRMKEIRIGERLIGNSEEVFIIAEAGVNHNGDLELAKRLIAAAKDAGADAIKFQSFITEEIISQGAPKAGHQLRHSDKDESQFDMIKRLELSEDDHKKLIAYANSKGIIFLSTPYDFYTVDWLDKYGVPAFKIASIDVDNRHLLKYVASKKKPIILSTGMSYLEEVRAGVDAVRGAGNTDIILLHCTSNYPTAKQDTNLNAIRTLAREFNTVVGYSDHTEGDEASLCAVCLGARVIEKHFTVDKKLAGPDHILSMDPKEFKMFIERVKGVESLLGSGEKAPALSEMANRRDMKRSLFTRFPVKKGELLTIDKIAFKRPGTGIAASKIDDALGRRSTCDIEPETMLSWEMIE
ncbi:MAG: N-acetylneuraminate synthase [Candidatus Omnitrophica bacterium]|nr:N-acetylneuraminate synthase [Candidatus Omnitrophota bacterium]